MTTGTSGILVPIDRGKRVLNGVNVDPFLPYVVEFDSCKLVVRLAYVFSTSMTPTYSLISRIFLRAVRGEGEANCFTARYEK